MAKAKIKSATDQRPFVMVYHDFLESDLLDNHYQKLVYIYLKKFADSKNQCFPSVKTLAKLTKISVNKVKTTLAELEQKGVIIKENRVRPNGGKSSNRYTLYDFKELWCAGSNKDVAAVADEISEAKLIAELRARGYLVIKEKELDSEPAKAQNQANRQLIQDNNTSLQENCQELERYTMSQIKEKYEYDYILLDYPQYESDVNTVMQILYDILNTSKPTVRIAGEDKPTMVVTGRLMELDKDLIVYSIEKYHEHTGKVNNPINYMITILYNAPEQFDLEVRNRINNQS